jgi:hypothetical protein
MSKIIGNLSKKKIMEEYHFRTPFLVKKLFFDNFNFENNLFLGASDSLSSTSEAGNASGPEVNTGDIGDNGKPLSFARIASLNLEKQAIGQKPPKNAGVEGTMVPSSGSGN